MENRDRETVVVEGDRRPNYGWLIALVVIALLVILFFAFGGANLFNGTADSDTTNINVPDTVEVQPGPQQ
jgi:hypothetical protein